MTEVINHASVHEQLSICQPGITKSASCSLSILRADLPAIKTSPELSAGAWVKPIEVSTGKWGYSCNG